MSLKRYFKRDWQSKLGQEDETFLSKTNPHQAPNLIADLAKGRPHEFFKTKKGTSDSIKEYIRSDEEPPLWLSFVATPPFNGAVCFELAALCVELFSIKGSSAVNVICHLCSHHDIPSNLEPSDMQNMHLSILLDSLIWQMFNAIPRYFRANEDLFETSLVLLKAITGTEHAGNTASYRKIDMITMLWQMLPSNTVIIIEGIRHLALIGSNVITRDCFKKLLELFQTLPQLTEPFTKMPKVILAAKEASQTLVNLSPEPSILKVRLFADPNVTPTKKQRTLKATFPEISDSDVEQVEEKKVDKGKTKEETAKKGSTSGGSTSGGGARRTK